MCGIAGYVRNKQNAGLRISVLIAALLTVFCVVSVSGQKVAKPNFTGIWVLDLKKSDSLAAKVLRSKLKKNERLAGRLEIDHKDPTVKIIETFMAEELDQSKNVINSRVIGRLTTVYYTNGKGETNRVDGRRDWGSTTVWRGDTIFVNRPVLDNSIDVTTLEFSLSKNADQLRIAEKTIQKLPGFRDNEIPSKSGTSIYVRDQPAVKVDK